MKAKHTLIVALAVVAVAGGAQAQDLKPQVDALKSWPAPEADGQMSFRNHAAIKARAAEQIADWKDRVGDFAEALNERSATAGGADDARVTGVWRHLNLQWEAFQAAERAEWPRTTAKLRSAFEQMEQAWQQRSARPLQKDQAGAPEKPHFLAIEVATRMRT